MSITVDFHALHTLPPSNINRDDTGAPKSGLFGGVVRQRVSSQAWKRAIRKDFETYLDRSQLGVRSKRTPQLIAKRMKGLAPELDSAEAEGRVDALFKAAKIKLHDDKPQDGTETAGKVTGYLLFLSEQQISRAAEFLIENGDEKVSKRDADAILDTSHSVDIAMFGRMVADAPDYNVDAAVQVAHALGVHESEPEFDFFTAVDDVVEDAEETGAGMLGTVQMMSSTLYRFASIDFESLAGNLGSREAAVEAAIAFAKSFVRSLPTGKLNTFANWTMPELVYVTVRDDRAVSLVNAFETPVDAAPGNSRRQAAAEALAVEAAQVEAMYGLAPAASWILAQDNLASPFAEQATRVSFDGLLEKLSQKLTEMARD